MMDDASGRRNGVQRWSGALVSDLQRRVAGAHNWLGVAVQEGGSAVARLGQVVEERRVMAVERVEAIGRRRGESAEVDLEKKKLWMRLSGFAAQVQPAVEAVVRMARSQGAAPRPLLAALSLGLPVRGEGVEGKHVFDIAMSAEQVSKRLDGVPVYTVSNSSNEFVLVSDLNTSKSLGIFCFREADAEALLSQVRDREPSLGRGAKVVAVSLDKVYQLSTEGIAFRFLPDPRQVRNALETRSRAGESGKAFDGVPVFQSDNLILRSNNRRFCPIFFSKEDLENALQRAFKQQQRVNPSLKVNTDIQVGSFEDVLKRMEVWLFLLFIFTVVCTNFGSPIIKICRRMDLCRQWKLYRSVLVPFYL
ncbi:hypothetical protein M758_4G076200 [Ceratodon purpureus]|nr:hypothetical protein M758_4G076200 [Ceratodon purpureus]